MAWEKADGKLSVTSSSSQWKMPTMKQNHPSFMQSPLFTGIVSKSCHLKCKRTIRRRQFAWSETYKSAFLMNSMSKEPFLPASSPGNPSIYSSCWLFLTFFPPRVLIIAVKKELIHQSPHQSLRIFFRGLGMCLYHATQHHKFCLNYRYTREHVGVSSAAFERRVFLMIFQ